jgi:hypothetical protein
MGIRLSGGLGPVRVSVPLSPRRRGGGSGGLIGLVAGLFKGMGLLLWWTLLGMWWLLRVTYWDFPRWVWRGIQRRRAARPAAATPGPAPRM